PDGDIWFCDRFTGIRRYRDGKLESFEDIPGMGKKRAVSAHSDKDGRIWLGFLEGGVAVYQNGRFDFYTEKDGIAGGSVKAIYGDKSGKVWFGADRGLSRFENGRFVTFNAKNGLPGIQISGILEDEAGSLWLAVGSGIVRVQSAEFDKAAADPSYRIEYKFYTAADGLRGAPLQLGYPAAVRAVDGKLWFTTSEGVAMMDPSRSVESSMPPPVLIEAVTTGKKTFEAVSNSSFPPENRKYQIDYTALSFIAPEKVRFRFKLEGFDRDWVD